MKSKCVGLTGTWKIYSCLSPCPNRRNRHLVVCLCRAENPSTFQKCPKPIVELGLLARKYKLKSKSGRIPKPSQWPKRPLMKFENCSLTRNPNVSNTSINWRSSETILRSACKLPRISTPPCTVSKYSSDTSDSCYRIFPLTRKCWRKKPTKSQCRLWELSIKSI